MSRYRAGRPAPRNIAIVRVPLTSDWPFAESQRPGGTQADVGGRELDLIADEGIDPNRRLTGRAGAVEDRGQRVLDRLRL